MVTRTRATAVTVEVVAVAMVDTTMVTARGDTVSFSLSP